MRGIKKNRIRSVTDARLATGTLLCLLVVLSACNIESPGYHSSTSRTTSSPSAQKAVQKLDESPMTEDRQKFEKTNVSQMSLDHLFASAKRIVIRKSEVHDKILYESNKKPDLALLKEVLRIEQPGPKAVPCRCVGSPIIELYFRKRYIGWIALHDNMSIRTSVWNSDAKLADPERFIKWFERRGMAEPRRRSLFFNTQPPGDKPF
jgi:hypothetical protein